MMHVVNVAMYSMALTYKVLLQVGHMIASKAGNGLKTRSHASRRMHNCLGTKCQPTKQKILWADSPSTLTA